jgi:KTSC domain
MKVRSSMIREVEWEKDTLYILFNTDEAYEYYKVPVGIYQKLIVAHKNGTSVGSFFDTYVKKAGYEYKKIDWATRRIDAIKNFDVYKRTCINFEKQGLMRREMDEDGNERILFTGELAGEQAKMFKGTATDLESLKMEGCDIDGDALASSRISGADDLDFEEDWLGQKTEYKRQKAVERAVSAADRIILDASDGTVEETNFLTSQVAQKFAEKVNMAMAHELRKKELLERARK